VPVDFTKPFGVAASVLAASDSAKITRPWRTMMEQDGVDPLSPPGTVITQIEIQPAQCPSLVNMCRRDPRLRDPVISQQHPQMLRVGPISLGSTLVALQSSSLSRISDPRAHPRCAELFRHIEPASATLHHELGVTTWQTPQPFPHPSPMRVIDPTRRYLPRCGIDVIKRDLSAVNIEAT
jgi:hypothetical protein